jgi:hypothetical protein
MQTSCVWADIFCIKTIQYPERISFSWRAIFLTNFIFIARDVLLKRKEKYKADSKGFIELIYIYRRVLVTLHQRFTQDLYGLLSRDYSIPVKSAIVSQSHGWIASHLGSTGQQP